MRPASAGSATGRQRSRLEIKVRNRGLFRRTEPRDADIQMQGFLDSGITPVLSFKASRQKVQASLVRPLQGVRTELMSIATGILDRVAGEWGCVEELVHEIRGDKISRRQAEEFIEQYLRHHNVPGKLQIRWVQNLNSGGKLQEYGRRDKPTERKLRLWISSRFAGVQFSRSMTAFADHEICTHAVRAINDHAQVWVNHRGRYGLCSGRRERLSTEEGLAALNSLLCYPSQTRHMWSAAMLYYCAVKGNDMGFGELHKHLIKYVRCPAKRYWYCVKTKGKRADLDQPGSCGKGQVYLEGAVDILRAMDYVDFHLLYAGRVPLSKLDRVKNIARSSLVTLPKFVRDQGKYKAILRQIAHLNGILPEISNPVASPKQQNVYYRKGRSCSPSKRRKRPVMASTGQEAATTSQHQENFSTGLSRRRTHNQQTVESTLPPSGTCGSSSVEDNTFNTLSSPHPPAAPPPTDAGGQDDWRGNTRNEHHRAAHDAVVTRGFKTNDPTSSEAEVGRHSVRDPPDQNATCFSTAKHVLGGERKSATEHITLCKRDDPSVGGDEQRRRHAEYLSGGRKSCPEVGILSPAGADCVPVRPRSAISVDPFGKSKSGGKDVARTKVLPFAGCGDCQNGNGDEGVTETSGAFFPHLG